jgi:hypothetical protein
MKIAVLGDSWGCGEWPTRTAHRLEVSHGGLAQYLKEAGHFVANYSVPGGSNYQTYDRFLKYQKIRSVEYDYLVWFQTGTLREHWEGTPWCIADFAQVRTYEQLMAAHRKILAHTYREFANLGVPILLIGGCSKADPVEASKYSAITVVIESAIEYLTPTISQAEIWAEEFKWMKSKMTPQLFFDMQKQNLPKLFDLGDNAPHLYKPDGSHPNRHAHWLLYEKLTEHLCQGPTRNDSPERS